jgi:transposase-like protein
MPKKKQESEKSLSAKSTIHQRKSHDVAYLTCDLGHLHKYQLESRDKDETFKCPECGKIVLYDSKNAIHASKPPKMSPMGGQTWLKNLKK